MREGLGQVVWAVSCGTCTAEAVGAGVSMNLVWRRGGSALERLFAKRVVAANNLHDSRFTND